MTLLKLDLLWMSIFLYFTVQTNFNGGGGSCPPPIFAPGLSKDRAVVLKSALSSFSARVYTGIRIIYTVNTGMNGIEIFSNACFLPVNREV